MPADCDTKDNTTGGDGTRTAPFSTDSIYKGIAELAAIYDVQDRGAALIAELQGRESEAIGLAQSIDLPELTAVFRSEEHTSELQSLMRISYAVFCLKKKNRTNQTRTMNEK